MINSWASEAFWGISHCMPSYDVMEQELMGQLCVIVNGTSASRCFWLILTSDEDDWLTMTDLHKRWRENGGEKKKADHSRAKKKHYMWNKGQGRQNSISSCGEALVPLVMCHNKEWCRTADAFTSGHNLSDNQLSVWHKGCNVMAQRMKPTMNTIQTNNLDTFTLVAFPAH